MPMVTMEMSEMMKNLRRLVSDDRRQYQRVNIPESVAITVMPEGMMVCSLEAVDSLAEDDTERRVDGASY